MARSPSVEVEVRDGVALLTLQDSARRNALTLEMAGRIGLLLDEVEARAEVGAVVVTGQGSAFCAGADLDVLAGGDAAEYRQLYEGFLRVARSPLPTIAAVNGPATGAGMNLALCCDVRLASPKARFVARFLDIGLHPGGGHTWMLARAVGQQRARAMVLCGEELDGRSAAAAGLVLRCVDDERLLEESLRLAAKAASIPRELVERTKATMNALTHVTDHHEAVDLEAEAQAWSATLPHFQDKVCDLRSRISARGGGSQS